MALELDVAPFRAPKAALMESMDPIKAKNIRRSSYVRLQGTAEQPNLRARSQGRREEREDASEWQKSKVTGGH